MTTQSADFTAARQTAFEHLSRFFTVEKLTHCPNNSQDAECWSVEIEVEKGGEVLCIVLRITLEYDFPLSLPRIHLFDLDDLKKLDFPPNIDVFGLICTFDSNTNIPNSQAPGQLVEVCVRQARQIVADAFKKDRAEKYNKEFIAYWEVPYQLSLVDTKVLSLISDAGPLPKRIFCVSLSQTIAGFNSILYSESDQLRNFENLFGVFNLAYKTTLCFHLGELKDLWPPFLIRNRDVVQLVNQAGLTLEFERYLSSLRTAPIVTFSKVIDERNLILGWKHRLLGAKNKKGQKVRGQKVKGQGLSVLNKQNEMDLVDRFSPQVFSRQRLVRRTAADYAGLQITQPLKTLVVGLGSVGSHLVSLLDSAGISEFHLVDSEDLVLENIGRHLLGLSDVGKPKVEAVREYLIKRNPLISVEVHKAKIVQLAEQDYPFMETSDYWFFCTGDINSETWLARKMEVGTWGRPSFFLWVEPYLAGGHCVYLSGQDAARWDDLLTDYKFVYNVISNKVYETRKFTKQEAGCQTTYQPYDALSMRLFLTMLLPKVLPILSEKSAKSRVFSWVGDLAALQSMNIDLSQDALRVGSFQLTERTI